MNLCIIGGAGRTGGHLVALALDRGHVVTVVARNRQRIAITGPRVVEGDATNPAVLAEAIGEATTVISTVAAPSRRRTSAVSDVTRAVVTTMGHLDRPGRLIITSSRNVTATQPRLIVGLTRMVFRHVYADLAQAEELVRDSELDWRIARATRLIDAPTRHGVWTDTTANATGGHWSLPRVDYAAALLDLAEDPTSGCQAIGVNGLIPGTTPPATITTGAS